MEKSICLWQRFANGWRRWQRRIRPWLVAIVFIFAVSVYVGGIEPRWLEVTQTKVVLPSLPPEFAGYRIVQISDIHFRHGAMDKAMLDRIVTIANARQPDAIVLTGDYITRWPLPQEPDLQAAWQKLRATDGIFAVMGNHDRANFAMPLLVAFKKAGVAVLNNQIRTIVRNGQKLYIAGVDDVTYRLADLNPILADLPANEKAILLAHEPDIFDRVAATHRFGLQLSGHSHGGQVAIPFLPRFTPPLAKKYIAGIYRRDDSFLYVSRGLGVTEINARFNCRPEIAEITLTNQ
jgi:uncharacterized protein